MLMEFSFFGDQMKHPHCNHFKTNTDKFKEQGSIPSPPKQSAPAI
jgi:hypothetical protein